MKHPWKRPPREQVLCPFASARWRSRSRIHRPASCRPDFPSARKLRNLATSPRPHFRHRVQPERQSPDLRQVPDIARPHRSDSSSWSVGLRQPDPCVAPERRRSLLRARLWQMRFHHHQPLPRAPPGALHRHHRRQARQESGHQPQTCRFLTRKRSAQRSWSDRSRLLLQQWRAEPLSRLLPTPGLTAAR